MEEFERIDEVETTLDSLRRSLFIGNCEWNRKSIKKEEQQIIFQNISENDLNNLIEINYIYIYEHDQIIVTKNKSKNQTNNNNKNNSIKNKQQNITVYRRIYRTWQPKRNISKNEIFKNNYDQQNHKVEIVILCKKYIPYPKVEQIQEILHFLQNNNFKNFTINKNHKIIYSLISSASLIHEFYSSQAQCFQRKITSILEENNNDNNLSSDKEKINMINNNKNQDNNDNNNKINEDLQINIMDPYEEQKQQDKIENLTKQLKQYNQIIKTLDDFIWKIIHSISKKITFSILIKLLLISIQYEFQPLSEYLYGELREYILRYQDVIQYENENPFLQEVMRNSSNEYLHVNIQSEVITLNTISQFNLNSVEQMHIDTIFFQNDFNHFYSYHKQLKQQLQKYQYFNVERTRSDNLIDFMMSESDYPHIYRLRNMHDKSQILIGIQNSEHSIIELYIEQNYQKNIDISNYKCYNQNYIGFIDRNYWGTQFILYGSGHDSSQNNNNNNSNKQFNQSKDNNSIEKKNHKDLSYNLLKYFLQQEKCENMNYSLIINYETNIMADAPRKFTAKAYNYKEKRFIEMKSLEPVYNEETETYQLNFYGRAKKSSARNFQVQDLYDDNNVFLLHGKNKKNSFSLDFSYPLNIVQAFAFSIVSISKKFLVA